MLCEYGCGNKATHQFKNGKWCCQEDFRSCKGFLKNRKKYKKQPKPIKYYGTGICRYGCNQKAKYIYLNESLCCSSHYNKCPSKIKKYSLERIGVNNPMYNKKHSQDTLKLMSKSQKNRKPESFVKNQIVSIETRKKISKILRRTILKIKNKYPTFFKVEEMRYNPAGIVEKEIQVHCKNHNCKNSKEQGGWFTPSGRQIELRLHEIENGNNGGYFYCSDQCKEECPLYYSRGNDPFKNKEKLYNEAEYQLFRSIVLERENYKCQYCEEKANIVHHILPQKMNPENVLDPDYGIVCCVKCHYKYGHRDRWCTTGYIAGLECNINKRINYTNLKGKIY